MLVDTPGRGRCSHDQRAHTTLLGWDEAKFRYRTIPKCVQSLCAGCSAKTCSMLDCPQSQHANFVDSVQIAADLPEMGP
eukprot:6960700-Pyramimonas_sp.AAC.1